jgi:hypothetical protein
VSPFFLLPARDDDPGMPARSSSTAWKPDRLDVESAAGDEPGDRGVRVPHLACAQFVAAPDGRWYLRHELEQATRAVGIVAEPLWAFDRLVDVGDQALAPASDLVPEEWQASKGSDADRAFADDAMLLVLSPHRRLLDHEPHLGSVDLQRRVVEVAAFSTSEPRRDSFEHLSVQPNGVAACAERQPVQVDAGGRRRGRHQRRLFSASKKLTMRCATNSGSSTLMM